LKSRVSEANHRLTKCNICGHKCNVDRKAGELGKCKTGENVRVSSFGPHFGEEDPLRGFRGSGTIFFSRCNLRCQYCQNYDISQFNSGFEVQPEELAMMMINLQERGCHNINFVSPSHVVPQILAALYLAAQSGLAIPLIYNTGGYDCFETLELLDGVIDIYMPDMKYSDEKIAKKYSKIPNYPEINRIAVKEMHRQVGDLDLDKHGIAMRGLLVRHLILPNNLSGSEDVIHFLVNDISSNTYLNLMDQYRPSYLANQYPELNRRITTREYRTALRFAQESGLRRLDQRKSPAVWFL
jgi:putative pyruvate formate lyase activating enzyme